MTPTEVYTSVYTESIAIGSGNNKSGCLITKFAIESNDIFWTILLTNNIENNCRRVVVYNESDSNPVVFLVSKTSLESPYDLLMLEIDSSNGNIIQTKVIDSGADDYLIEDNSN